ncbi:tyrosine-type recombinase/integrase [Rubripirellula reticaptiva]|uniref:Tyrosine recombinase XerD n=1 Tax=Rubripirellula reticaptiva TaxID=2528013 RepID=A0A5C6EM51_9BACT|nr:tyrosine-type recombinase/integrase [Rubripirellula reticaptiva]TWU49424.1 Tyrosine recombinase XerD [Rubripirellula reticaptiva]
MSSKREAKPFFRKSKNAWYLQLGKRQVSLGREKKQAWQKYHQLMADSEPIRETATVEMLFERYLDWVEENRKPGTYSKIRDNLSSFAKFIGKQTKIATLSGSDLSNWAEGQSTWSSTTRNEGIGSVVRCFNWAVGKKYLKTNTVAQVPDKPRRKRRETVISTDEWTTLLGFVKDQAFRDLLCFMWEVGCRPLEARTMEAKHVNLDAGIVIFPPSEAKGERHERVIYLTEAAKQICARLVAKWPTGPIMRNTRNRPWTKDSINCRFSRLKKKTGKRVFAYAIRHSFATQGLIDGVDSVTLSQLMGHADVSTLAKNYAHLSRNQRYLKEQAESVRKRPDAN